MKNKYTIAVMVLGLGISGYAFAQISGGQLSACVERNGESHFVLTGFTKKQVCEKGEQLVSWNIAGLPGPQGPQGVAGKDGASGGAGMQGLAGQKGDPGPAGNQYHLYDANNQDLGVLMYGPRYSNDSFETFLPDLGVFVSFHDTDHGPSDIHLAAGEGSTILYTGVDCTGDSFTTVGAALSVQRDAQGRYFTATNDAPITRTFVSQFSTDGCTNQPQYAYQNTFLLKQITLPFSDLLFKPVHVGLPQ